jgi:hypothetical protein
MENNHGKNINHTTMLLSITIDSPLPIYPFRFNRKFRKLFLFPIKFIFPRRHFQVVVEMNDSMTEEKHKSKFGELICLMETLKIKKGENKISFSYC